MGFLEDWKKFLEENWTWFLPLVTALAGPIIASGMNIAWDYMKLKGWIR